MNQPWMTRREAADYLGVSVDTIDRRCIHYAVGRVEGKLRFKLMKWDVKRVRILAEDVYAILPLPKEMEVAS